MAGGFVADCPRGGHCPRPRAAASPRTGRRPADPQGQSPSWSGETEGDGPSRTPAGRQAGGILPGRLLRCASAESWCAQIEVARKKHAVYSIPDARSAAIARDRMALALVGPAAVLNFPTKKLAPATPDQLRVQYRKRKPAAHGRYIGARKVRHKAGWCAYMNLLGRGPVMISGFASERDAAEARDRMALYALGPRTQLNFPERRLKPISPEALRQQMRELRDQTSKYEGVWFRSNSRTSVLHWCAAIMVRGRPLYLGGWETERAAALAVDRARLHYLGPRGRFNFPRLVKTLKPANAETLAVEAYRAFKAGTTSQFRGVCRPRGCATWVAQIGHHGRNIHLGCFSDEVDAARAYDRAALKLHGAKAKLNFPQPQPRPRRARARARGVCT